MIQWRARPEVSIGFAGLQGPDVSLMATHADVVRKPGRKFGRIHDRTVDRARNRRSRQSFVHVQFTRSMAVLAADRQL